MSGLRDIPDHDWYIEQVSWLGKMAKSVFIFFSILFYFIFLLMDIQDKSDS